MLVKFSLLSLSLIFYPNFIVDIYATNEQYLEITNASKYYLANNKAHGGSLNYSGLDVFTNEYQSKSKEFTETKKVLSKRSVNEKRQRRRTRIGNCQKVDFNVNFVELGWDKWILFPKIFNAHICSGDCSLPLTSQRRKSYFSYSSSLTSSSSSSISEASSTFTSSVVQVTNHAQIMSILEFKHPEINKHMTKCVSTKLKPLTVVFLDDYGQIKTKQYQDMIVEECGCR